MDPMLFSLVELHRLEKVQGPQKGTEEGSPCNHLRELFSPRHVRRQNI